VNSGDNQQETSRNAVDSGNGEIINSTSVNSSDNQQETVGNEWNIGNDVINNDVNIGVQEEVIHEWNIGNDIQESSTSIVDSCLLKTGIDDQCDDADVTYLDSFSSDEPYSSSDECSLRESSSEYCPTPLRKARYHSIVLGNSLFVCQTSRLQEFIGQVNNTSMCYTLNCTRKLVPVDIKNVGLGGGVVVKFTCSQCTEWMLNLTSSVDVAFSRRTVCSLAI